MPETSRPSTTDPESPTATTTLLRLSLLHSIPLAPKSPTTTITTSVIVRPNQIVKHFITIFVIVHQSSTRHCSHRFLKIFECGSSESSSVSVCDETRDTFSSLITQKTHIDMSNSRARFEIVFNFIKAT
ncbi:unnamed protein product [Lactuca virosa]|uniref:Uncharacterized protein n=1 Tax=Lactuca virosa TaxID=75947 RepID=A0AAU9NY31_9ASTR|nr:unnamed protein product [Lactuca virosa]